MMPSAWVLLALGLWLAMAIAMQWASQIFLRNLLSKTSPPAPRPLPSATVLTPLGRETPGLAQNLEKLCAAGAPVIAGIDEARSDALAAASAMKARVGPGTLTIVRGEGPAGANRKVSMLMQMLPAARGEILIFVDGDILVPAGYLEAVLAPFADPGVGIVTCPYRSVGGSTAASRVDALMTNTGFLPSVALAARVEGVRFALGGTLAIRRNLLEAIGGLAPLLHSLADDWTLADRARRAGRRIALAPLLLDHRVGTPTWGAMWRRHLRWSRTLRAVRPAGYAGTILTQGWLAAAGLAMVASPRVGMLALAAWIVTRFGAVLLNARRTGIDALDLTLLPLADLLSLAAFAGAFTGRTVRWGGSRLRVGPGGTIRPAGEDASG